MERGARSIRSILVLFTIAGAGLWNALLLGCSFFLREHWKAVLRCGHIVDVTVMAVCSVWGGDLSQNLFRSLRTFPPLE